MDALRAVLVALLIPATNAFPLPFVPAGRLPLTLQLAAIYVVVVLATLSGQFFNPARTALMADIVPDTYRARAAGLGQASQSVAMLLGPALAPVLAISVGVEWAVAANALSFVVSFFTILRVHLPAQETSIGREPGQRVGEGSAIRQFYAGIAIVARNRILSTLVISVALVMLGAAAINTLDIFFALHNLHARPQLYGLLSTAMGIGVLAGSILAAALAERLGLVRVFSLSLLAAGVLVVAYSRMTSLAPALVLTAVVGIAQAALNTVVAPLFLRVTLREYVGRVSAIVMSTAAFAQLIGTIVTGFLAGQVLVDFHLELHGLAFGPFDTIIGGGGVIVVLGALYALLRLGERRGASDSQDTVATQSTVSALQAMPGPTLVG
jgi:MFS family permease